jgi:hypothetical protein
VFSKDISRTMVLLPNTSITKLRAAMQELAAGIKALEILDESCVQETLQDQQIHLVALFHTPWCDLTPDRPWYLVVRATEYFDRPDNHMRSNTCRVSLEVGPRGGPSNQHMVWPSLVKRLDELVSALVAAELAQDTRPEFAYYYTLPR